MGGKRERKTHDPDAQETSKGTWNSIAECIRCVSLVLLCGCWAAALVIFLAGVIGERFADEEAFYASPCWDFASAGMVFTGLYLLFKYGVIEALDLIFHFLERK